MTATAYPHQSKSVENVLDDVLDLFFHYTHVKPLPNDVAGGVATAHIVGTLWTVGTWFVAECNAYPYIMISAAERNSGKSTVQQLMRHLVANPVKASNASPAAIYYACSEIVTLLIDEADQWLQDPQMIGILNSGYESSGAVLRVDGEGKNRALKSFPTYGAKAIAGIGAGDINIMLSSRCVTMQMERKPDHIHKRDIDNLDENQDYANELTLAHKSIAACYNDYVDDFINARPPIPNFLQNRNRQLWKPLLKIAYLGGQLWYEAATAAAKAHCDQQKITSANENLLADIQEYFSDKSDAFVTFSDLLTSLCDDATKPWVGWNRGKAITARQISERLKSHGIFSVHNSRKTSRGYLRADFESVWTIYCPQNESEENDWDAYTPENSVRTVHKSLEAATVLVSSADKEVFSQSALSPPSPQSEPYYFDDFERNVMAESEVKSNE